jgi:hypothetical protein
MQKEYLHILTTSITSQEENTKEHHNLTHEPSNQPCYIRSLWYSSASINDVILLNLQQSYKSDRSFTLKLKEGFRLPPCSF